MLHLHHVIVNLLILGLSINILGIGEPHSTGIGDATWEQNSAFLVFPVVADFMEVREPSMLTDNKTIPMPPHADSDEELYEENESSDGG